jgi:hypothetical protein
VSEQTAFEGWAIVEIMGHRRLAGFVTEQQLAGAGFLRLDIVGRDTVIDEDDGPEVALKGGFEGGVTQFYSPSAVYCVTPTTQDIADWRRELELSSGPLAASPAGESCG